MEVAPSVEAVAGVDAVAVAAGGADIKEVEVDTEGVGGEKGGEGDGESTVPCVVCSCGRGASEGVLRGSGEGDGEGKGERGGARTAGWLSGPVKAGRIAVDAGGCDEGFS